MPSRGKAPAFLPNFSGLICSLGLLWSRSDRVRQADPSTPRRDLHYKNVKHPTCPPFRIHLRPVQSKQERIHTMRINPAFISGVFNPRLLLTFILFAVGASLAMFSWASNPATSNITVPGSAGQKVQVTWTGDIPALVNGTSDCSNLADTPAADQHVSTVNVPAGLYNSVNAKFTFRIEWDKDAGNDEILTVLNPDGTTLDSSDGGDPHEEVTATNLPAGAYKIIACGFISGPTPQSYLGKVTIA